MFEERLILVAPKSFPPLDNTREISGKTVIAFEAGCAYRRYLEQWLLDAGIVPGGIMAVGSCLAIFACVSAGTGFAVVPQSVLDVVATKGSFPAVFPARADVPDQDIAGLAFRLRVPEIGCPDRALADAANARLVINSMRPTRP